jgi:hypothetical protein
MGPPACFATFFERGSIALPVVSDANRRLRNHGPRDLSRHLNARRCKGRAPQRHHRPSLAPSRSRSSIGFATTCLASSPARMARFPGGPALEATPADRATACPTRSTISKAATVEVRRVQIRQDVKRGGERMTTLREPMLAIAGDLR